jgi:fluoride exporter
LQKVLIISLGAIVGANLRYFVSQYVAQWVPSSFPYGTLVINISASFLLGLFMVWTSERMVADPRWRLLIAVGFCGGYSTFSSYAYDTVAMFEKGLWFWSGANVVASNILCLLAVVLGGAVARLL